MRRRLHPPVHPSQHQSTRRIGPATVQRRLSAPLSHKKRMERGTPSCFFLRGRNGRTTLLRYKSFFIDDLVESSPLLRP